jgi:hypothetical protein
MMVLKTSKKTNKVNNQFKASHCPIASRIISITVLVSSYDTNHPFNPPRVGGMENLDATTMCVYTYTIAQSSHKK